MLRTLSRLHLILGAIQPPTLFRWTGSPRPFPADRSQPCACAQGQKLPPGRLPVRRALKTRRVTLRGTQASMMRTESREPSSGSITMPGMRPEANRDNDLSEYVHGKHVERLDMDCARCCQWAVVCLRANRDKTTLIATFMKGTSNGTNIITSCALGKPWGSNKLP